MPISCSKAAKPSFCDARCALPSAAGCKASNSHIAMRSTRCACTVSTPKRRCKRCTVACRTSGCIVSCCDSSSIITPWRNAPRAASMRSSCSRSISACTIATPPPITARRSSLSPASCTRSTWPASIRRRVKRGHGGARDGAVGQTFGAQHVRHGPHRAGGAVDRVPALRAQRFGCSFEHRLTRRPARPRNCARQCDRRRSSASTTRRCPRR